MTDDLFQQARELFEDDFRVRDLAKILQELAHLKADHQRIVGELVDVILSYRKLDHSTCGEYDGLDHRCTKCKVADAALERVSK